MLDDYSVEDLTRAFFREFLIQNRFGKTYEAFENEDVRSKAKIPKATLIKSLCMEHLISLNRKLEKPLKSLAEILISYLKNKHVNRQKENQNHSDKYQPQRVKSEIRVELTPELVSKQYQPALNQQSITVEPLSVKPVIQEEALPSRVTTMRRINKKETKVNQSLITDETARHDDVPLPSRQESIVKPEEILNINNQQADAQTKKLDTVQNGLTVTEKASPPIVQQPKPPIITEAVKEPKLDIQTKIPLTSIQQTSEQPSNGQPEKKMMMFGKRKQVQPKEQQKKQHQIFSKDVESLTQVKQTYSYQKIDLNAMTTKIQLTAEFAYKKPQFPMRANTKKKQKPISYEQSSTLRKILFQQQCKGLPKAWCQGLLLSPHESTFYGLEQIEGGPCGIVAALQCYYLKHLLYLCPTKKFTQQTRQNCLFAAVADLLYKMNPTRVLLALPTVATVYANEPVSVENIEILTIPVKNLQQLYEQIYQYKTNFLGKANHGYTLLLYSCILTKGCEQIELEMDSSLSPLIGNHGHCNQQLVNLFLTGNASTNCFDGVKVLGDGIDKVVLKGITGQQEFGFLTIFQSLGYIEVGKNLKNPSLPIWVICKQFHYHVIFANHYLISEENKTQKFDVVYFDGLYNCKDKIVLTLSLQSSQDPVKKLKDLPMIQQVLLTKWGRRGVDWNGSIPIL